MVDVGESTKGRRVELEIRIKDSEGCINKVIKIAFINTGKCSDIGEQVQDRLSRAIGDAIGCVAINGDDDETLKTNKVSIDVTG